MKCEVCSRDQESRVCVKCASRMRSQLEDLPNFLYDAGGALMPGKVGGSRSKEIQIGIRIDALDFVAGFDIVPVLEAWEKDWRRFFELAPFGPASIIRFNEAGPNADPVGVRMNGSIGFLNSWLDKACDRHPAIDDFGREIAGLWRQAQAAAGQQPRSAWSVTCPADSTDGECGRPIRITGEDFGGSVCCPGCRTNWTIARLLMVVASSRHAELWLDPEAASTFFGIPTRDLRRWAAAGRIRRHRNRYESHSIREAIAAAS